MERTTLYLPTDLQRALRDESRRRGLPQAELVRSALRSYLAASGRPDLRSLGLGEDSSFAGRDSEAWLEREWGRR